MTLTRYGSPDAIARSIAGPICDGSVTVSYGYTPTGGTSFPWAFTVASFDEDGNNTMGQPPAS